MLSEKIFNSIECISRKVRQETRPFGGMQVIASGIFFSCHLYLDMTMKESLLSRASCGMSCFPTSPENSAKSKGAKVHRFCQ